MCGIAGLLAPGRLGTKAVGVMMDRMAHRGPDGEGVWRSEDGRCVLGHRRLAIIDTAGGRQPMVDAERGLAITFNGEIYNYLELRERLAALGHAFRTRSDTEVLLAAYAQWGAHCLAELNGMFAFCIWDAARRELFCARDRFGEKPLHYAWLPGGGFAFASEIKALAVLEGVDLGIDAGVMSAFIEGGATWLDAHERTLLRGVEQLLPAEAMVLSVDGQAVRVARRWFYWSIDVRGRHPYGADDPRASAGRLLELLTDSVRLRLRSDVTVGSCLSGGLDSSSIVALIRQLEPGADLRTFTGRFPGDPLDEGRYASLVATASAARPAEVMPTPERFTADAQRLYWHAELPIGGLSQFAQWCVFHLASQHGVIVLLDGQGSDEQLGGYGNDITRAFLGQLLAEGRVGAWLAERKAAARTNAAAFSWARLLGQTRLARPGMHLLRRLGGRSHLTRASLFDRGFVEAANREHPRLVLPTGSEDGALSRTLWQLSFRTMLSSLLRFGDRLSMAHSREVRLPFCDHRIAELAFSVSPDLLLGDGQVKRLLRIAARGLVPPEIVARPKQGFVPPQGQWLLGPLAGWVEALAEDAGPLGHLLDGGAIARLARAPRQVRARELGSLWDAANLLAWSRFALAPLSGLARYGTHE